MHARDSVLGIIASEHAFEADDWRGGEGKSFDEMCAGSPALQTSPRLCSNLSMASNSLNFCDE